MNAGYAGRLAGINGRPMAAGEAAAALAAALAERVAAVAAKEAQLLAAGAAGVGNPTGADADAPPEPLKPLTWYDMCHCVATAAALMMVRDLLHPTKATVVFNRSFEQKNGGGSLQPSWSLGAYLQLLEDDEEKERGGGGLQK